MRQTAPTDPYSHAHDLLARDGEANRIARALDGPGEVDVVDDLAPDRLEATEALERLEPDEHASSCGCGESIAGVVHAPHQVSTLKKNGKGGISNRSGGATARNRAMRLFSARPVASLSATRRLTEPGACRMSASVARTYMAEPAAFRPCSSAHTFPAQPSQLTSAANDGQALVSECGRDRGCAVGRAVVDDDHSQVTGIVLTEEGG